MCDCCKKHVSFSLTAEGWSLGYYSQCQVYRKVIFKTKFISYYASEIIYKEQESAATQFWSTAFEWNNKKEQIFHASLVSDEV